MQTSLTSQAIAELTHFAASPCLSLYQPTHRHHPDNQQDPLRFRQGIQTLESSLRERHSAQETQAMMAPFHELAANTNFWNHTLDGLAVFAGAGLFRIFLLPRTLTELAVVADSFHLKPLRKFLQSTGRYQVLALNRSHVRLFEGNRDSLSEIELPPGVPHTIEEALGEEFSEAHHTVSSYGGLGGASSPMHHGHGSKKDEVDKDTERFFRIVDRAIDEHCSKHSGLALILAALPEYHHLFHKISHNRLLIAEGVHISPDALTLDQLRQKVWAVIEPQYLAQQSQLANEFRVAHAKNLGSDHLEEVARAAVAGRVETLLIEADRQIAGHLDEHTGSIIAADLKNPVIDDLLDDLAEWVQKKGGQVHVLMVDRMPCQSGVAAIYRH